MGYKSNINKQNLDSESAKEMELDERARPTRKLERPEFPATDSATTSIHRRVKGTRKKR